MGKNVRADAAAAKPRDGADGSNERSNSSGISHRGVFLPYRKAMGARLLSTLLYFLVPAATLCMAHHHVLAATDAHLPLPFVDVDAPYAACKLTSALEETVTPRERCYMAKLALRCSPADDCLVQCIARGFNGQIGGGCWHVCFATKFNLSEWTEPPGMKQCHLSPEAAP